MINKDFNTSALTKKTQVSVGKLIQTPSIPIVTPGVPMVRGDYVPSDSVVLQGEPPYTSGTISNRLNNVMIAKRETVDGQVASEIAAPMYMTIEGFKLSPGGIRFNFKSNDDPTQGYEYNRAAEQAITAAFTAQQALVAKQLTNLALTSRYETFSNEVPVFFITGMILSYLTNNLTTFLIQLGRLSALANYLVTYDKDNQNYYMEFNQQMSRRQIVNAIAVLCNNITNIPMNTTIFNMLIDVLPLHKASKGYNSPITELENEPLYNEALVLTPKTNVASLYNVDKGPRGGR